MGLKKCPICELNYIQETDKYCDVCRRNIKGESEPDGGITVCVECGENPAVKGSELCAICLREARRQEKILNSSQDAGDMDSVSLVDVEMPLPGDDVPENELEEIDKELGGGMGMGELEDEDGGEPGGLYYGDEDEEDFDEEG